MPRFRSIGFMPAATCFIPSCTIDCASTVAVVVPSPATSAVFDATCFTTCAPMFSRRSFSSISFATETPSFVMVGAPKLRSISTLRPLGPSVTFTASASTFTPLTIRLRALSWNLTSFALMLLLRGKVVERLSGGFARRGGVGFQHTHHVFFAHDEQFLAVHLDGLACVFAEENLIADV